MIVWMLYSALVALVVAAAGRAAERVARLAGYRVRWVWAGALALTAFISASALLRETGPAAIAAAESSTIDLGKAGDVQADASWRGALGVRLEALRRALDAPVRATVSNVQRAVSPAADVIAASLSLVLSVGLGLVLVGVGRRFRSARRGWPLMTVQGVDVRVAPRVGPVVVGLVRPEIVVPRWLLARHADQQRLVVTHEAEHVRARDPLLLGLAWGAVVLAPWNPAVWYMLSRLRLAVELDCDARVLRRGAAPRSYGSLLIDVAQHASALRLSALALADDSSHLRQRILAMTPGVPRFARLRAALAAAFAFAGVLVACQATLPNRAEIERTDVATATRAAREPANARHADTTVVHAVDGATATSSEASARAPGASPSPQAGTRPARKPTHVDIETPELASGAAAGDAGRAQRIAPTEEGTAGRADSLQESATLPGMNKPSFPGLIFIDGVRATESQMRALDRTQIESIDVLKGAYAAQHYGDLAGANGVIVITTKRGGTE